jgi:hypothetical protein
MSDSETLRAAMQTAITESVVQAALANPLNFPKRLQILVKRVARKRKTSAGYRRAMENLRKSAAQYAVNNADKLPAMLEDAREQR